MRHDLDALERPALIARARLAERMAEAGAVLERESTHLLDTATFAGARDWTATHQYAAAINGLRAVLREWDALEKGDET